MRQKRSSNINKIMIQVVLHINCTVSEPSGTLFHDICCTITCASSSMVEQFGSDLGNIFNSKIMIGYLNMLHHFYLLVPALKVKHFCSIVAVAHSTVLWAL